MESLSQQPTAYIRMHPCDDYSQIYLYAIEIPKEDSKKEITTCKICGSDVHFPSELEEGHGSNKKVFYKVSEPEYVLRIHPISDHKFPFERSSWCVLGSTIYSLGGRYERDEKNSRKVYFFDTNGPEIKWERGPSMINGRSKPFVTILGGKIYALGGTYDFTREGITQPWGEVFDPCLKTWEPLPPPPFDIDIENNDDVNGFSLDNRKKIFVLGIGIESDVLYSFDVTTRSWHVFDEIYYGKKFSDPYVVVGETLYWISSSFDCCLEAYDLNKRKTFMGQIPLEQVREISNHKYFRVDNDPSLLHLGGEKFCLLWVDAKCKTDYGFKCIHCTKFSVSKGHDMCGKDEGVLKVTSESSTSYLVDGRHRFVDGVLL